MRNLGALSLLFGALIAVPAAILAWLGWQSTTSFEEQARTAVLRETLDVAGGIANRVREREAAALATCRAGLRRAAERC